MKQTDPVIHSDPEIMGGTPVFVGTRVPLATLLDYLEAGEPLTEFLEDFPTVTCAASSSNERRSRRRVGIPLSGCWLR